MSNICLHPPLIVNIKGIIQTFLYVCFSYLKWSPSARTVSICIPPIRLKMIALWPPSTTGHKHIMTESDRSSRFTTSSVPDPGICCWTTGRTFVLFYDAAFIFLLSQCFVRSQWPWATKFKSAPLWDGVDFCRKSEEIPSRWSWDISVHKWWRNKYSKLHFRNTGLLESLRNGKSQHDSRNVPPQ